MYEFYVAAGIIYLLLLLTAGVVFIIRARYGSVSMKKIVAVIAALSVLEISALICMGGFILALAPDGFHWPESLFFAGFGILISLFTAMFALWLMAMPIIIAALFLAPAVVLIGAGIADVWQIIAEEAIFKGPFFCLFVIVALWVWRELRAPAP